jgi:hypothetical protein
MSVDQNPLDGSVKEEIEMKFVKLPGFDLLWSCKIEVSLDAGKRPFNLGRADIDRISSGLNEI